MRIHISRTVTLNGNEIRREIDIELEKPDDFVFQQAISYVEEKPILCRLEHIPESGFKKP